MRVSRSTFKLELEVQDSRSEEKVDESEFEIGMDSRTDDRRTRVVLTGKDPKKQEVRIREPRTWSLLCSRRQWIRR